MSTINETINHAIEAWADENMPKEVHAAVNGANLNLYNGPDCGTPWQASLTTIRAWLENSLDILPAYYDYQTGEFLTREPEWEEDSMAEIYDLSDSLYAGLFGKELASYI
jgi:hypothetical protein